MYVSLRAFRWLVVAANNFLNKGKKEGNVGACRQPITLQKVREKVQGVTVANRKSCRERRGEACGN